MAQQAQQLDAPIYALSPEQRRVWQCCNAEVAESNTGNAALAPAHAADGSCIPVQHLLLQCAVSNEQLGESINTLIEKHDILRARLVWKEGLKAPRLYLGKPKTLSWLPQADADPMAVAETAIRENLDGLPLVAQVLTLASAQLLSAQSLPGSTMSAQPVFVLLSLSALQADSQTPRLLVAALNQNLAGGRDDEDQLGFLDYIIWQEDLLADNEAAADKNEALGFFEQIDSSPLPLQLSLSSQVGGEPSSSSVYWQQAIPAHIVGACQAACLKYDKLKLQHLLQGAISVLLWRLGGREAFRLASEHDLRDHICDLSRTMGPISQSFSMRQDLLTDSTLLDVGLAIASNTEAVAQWLEFLGARPVAEVAEGVSFVYVETSPSSDACRLNWQARSAVKQELIFQFTYAAAPEQLSVSIGASALHNTATNLDTLGRGLLALLSSATAAWQTTIGSISLLDDTDIAYYRSLCQPRDVLGQHTLQPPTLLAAFYQQLRQRADSKAVCCRETALTYRQLNHQAAVLAVELKRRLAGGEARVAVALDRSVAMVVAILACCKAGICYVPLDPANARARLRYQLSHSGVSVLLSQYSVIATLPSQLVEDFGARDSLVTIETLPALLADPPIETEGYLWSTPAPDSIIYIIYTSGSTGQPKGVAVTHHNVACYLASALARLDWQPGLQFATVSTISADLGNTVILGSLFSGGTLHVLDNQTATSGQAFADYCGGQAIDVLKIVPSHFQALWLTVAAADRAALLPGQLIFGGEVLPPDLLDEIARCSPSTQVVNHYGPTETTIGALMAIIDDNTTIYPDVPLGTANFDTPLMLCDSAGQALPKGCSGELYIGGVQVAQGYWRAAEISKERFVSREFFEPDTIAVDRQQSPLPRWYKTGDRVYFDDKQQCRFIGRWDSQIKIRGYRVELGEIEKQIAKIAGIRSVVVDYRVVATEFQDSPAKPDRSAGVEQSLVAYVIFDDNHILDLSDLRHQLADVIPDYMLPQYLVVLKRLPLNHNGKVERARLSDPSQTRAKNYLAPRSSIEVQLVDFFATVLKLPEIGVLDDFFDSGGHSLGAVRLSALVRDNLDAELDPMAVFQYRTVARLAEHIQARQQAIPAAKEPLFLPLNAPAQQVFLCVAPSSRQRDAYKPLADHLAGRAQVLVLDPSALLWREELGGQRLEAIAQASQVYADALLSYLGSHYPGGVSSLHLLGWSFGGVLAQHLAVVLQDCYPLASLTLIDSRLVTRSEAASSDPLQRFQEYLPKNMVEALEILPSSQVDAWRERLANVPADEQIHAVITLAEELGILEEVTATEHHSQHWQAVLEARERFHALLHEHDVAPCKVRMCVVWASDTLDRWQEKQLAGPDWLTLCATEGEEFTLPGDHYGILLDRKLFSLMDAMLASTQNQASRMTLS